MNGLLLKIAAFLIVCQITSLPAIAEEITLYAEDGWPPYSYPDGTGMSNQKVIDAFALQGIKVNVKVLPFARIINLLESNKVMFGINVAQTPSTKKQFLFHAQPLFTSNSHFYYWHDNPLIATTKEQLSPTSRIGTILGYDYGEFIDQNPLNLTIERVKSHEQNLKKLSAHRLDAILLFDEVAKQVIAKNNLEGKLIKGPKGNSIDIYAAFAKQHPDTEKYLAILNQGLAQLNRQ